MIAYALRRVATVIPVMLVVSTVVFFLLRLAPGDPILMVIDPDDLARLNDEQLDALYAEYGLDDPLPLQYLSWLGAAVTGDLGWSIPQRQPVTEALLERLPISLELAAISLTMSVIIGIPLGILAATKRGTAMDSFATGFAVAGVSLPNFWLALLLMFTFAFTIPIFPPAGYTSPTTDLGSHLSRMVLPSVALAATVIATVMRMTRSSLLEVLRRDYMNTAKAKGLPRRPILIRHALRNAMIPVITVIGLQAGRVLSGVFLIEFIFAVPGLGKLGVDAIFGRDFALVQGVVLFTALLYVLINLAVDLTYAALDPRVRYD